MKKSTQNTNLGDYLSSDCDTARTIGRNVVGLSSLVAGGVLAYTVGDHAIEHLNTLTDPNVLESIILNNPLAVKVLATLAGSRFVGSIGYDVGDFCGGVSYLLEKYIEKEYGTRMRNLIDTVRDLPSKIKNHYKSTDKSPLYVDPDTHEKVMGPSVSIKNNTSKNIAFAFEDPELSEELLYEDME